MAEQITGYLSIVLSDFWSIVLEMSPYLLFGFFVAGILSIFISQSLVQRHLGGKGIWPLVKASIFGVPLPLCSCGVIPVSISLHKHGASKGATIAFLLSTPQTGADSIFVTLSLLGPLFAVFRPIAAFVTGIVGGTLVNLFGGDSQRNLPQQCNQSCCNKGTLPRRVLNGLKYGFVELPRDIARAMLVGLVIAAFISAIVPDNFFAEKLGTGIFAMIIMIFLGMPVYVCATASVPIAAALILKGLTPGAALVFLMTGPATNAASFVTIYRSLGTKTAVIYIFTVAGCALLSGVVIDYFAVVVDFQIISRPGWMLPTIVKYVCAAVLLVTLAVAFVTGRKTHSD